MKPPETITIQGYSEIRDCAKDEPLTRRERFAMAAMQGFCGNSDYAGIKYEVLAKTARQQADAMIAELEAHPTP